jgi:DNA-binding HxlR family transcriptional regulator
MAKRSYRQNCALAHAADLLGERWSLLLIRDLMVGPRRYNELSRSLKGMGTNLLATRLKELEASGLIERQPAGTKGQSYALTNAGRELEPTLLALIRWGLKYGPAPIEEFHHQNDWDLLALKSLFQSDKAGDLDITVQFAADGFEGWMHVNRGMVNIGHGHTAGADVRVDGTIKALFLGDKPRVNLITDESMIKLEKFMNCFPGSTGRPMDDR